MQTSYYFSTVVQVPFDLKDKVKKLEQEYSKNGFIGLSKAAEIFEIDDVNYDLAIVKYVNYEINNDLFLIFTGSEIQISDFISRLIPFFNFERYVVGQTIYSAKRLIANPEGLDYIEDKSQVIFKFDERFNVGNIPHGNEWIINLYNKFANIVGTKVVIEFDSKEKETIFFNSIGLTADEARQVISCTTINGFYFVYNFMVHKPIKQYLAEVLSE